jgi:hypothetical protein
MKNTTKLKKLTPENGVIKVALGEVTGHHHSFNANSVVAYEDDINPENTYVDIITPQATLTHQEHSPLTFTARKIMCIRQCEGSLQHERRIVAD